MDHLGEALLFVLTDNSSRAHTQRERERQRERQRDRQTDRERERQTERQTERETDRERESLRGTRNSPMQHLWQPFVSGILVVKANLLWTQKQSARVHSGKDSDDLQWEGPRLGQGHSLVGPGHTPSPGQDLVWEAVGLELGRQAGLPQLLKQADEVVGVELEGLPCGRGANRTWGQSLSLHGDLLSRRALRHTTHSLFLSLCFPSKRPSLVESAACIGRLAVTQSQEIVNKYRTLTRIQGTRKRVEETGVEETG